MQHKQLEAIDRDIHPNAEDLAKEYVDHFAVSLVLQAKIIAHDQKADVVLSNHVREARRMLSKPQRQRWRRDLLIVIGGVLLGALAPSFIGSLLQLHEMLVMASAASGILGIMLIFLGLRR